MPQPNAWYRMVSADSHCLCCLKQGFSSRLAHWPRKGEVQVSWRERTCRDAEDVGRVKQQICNCTKGWNIAKWWKYWWEKLVTFDYLQQCDLCNNSTASFGFSKLTALGAMNQDEPSIRCDTERFTCVVSQLNRLEWNQTYVKKYDKLRVSAQNSSLCGSQFLSSCQGVPCQPLHTWVEALGEMNALKYSEQWTKGMTFPHSKHR